MKGRKRRLSPALFEAAAPVGDASDPAPPPPVEITDETTSPRSIRPGLRQYRAPALQQPAQPWFDQSDTPLPLKVSEKRTRANATDDVSPPQSDTAGSPSANADTTPGSIMLS